MSSISATAPPQSKITRILKVGHGGMSIQTISIIIKPNEETLDYEDELMRMAELDAYTNALARCNSPAAFLTTNYVEVQQ